jgi:hypothetical protein
MSARGALAASRQIRTLVSSSARRKRDTQESKQYSILGGVRPGLQGPSVPPAGLIAAILERVHPQVETVAFGSVDLATQRIRLHSRVFALP